MSNVTVETRDGKLIVTSPYHHDFPAAAKNLGGKFSKLGGKWSFDPRDEARVRKLCTETFGTDGAGPVRLCTVRLAIKDRYDDAHRPAIEVSGEQKSLFALGREIAHRAGRDSAVRLGTGVVIHAEGFDSRGGSAKYPALSPKRGCVVEVRDVPLPLAEAAQEEWSGAVEILAEPADAAAAALKLTAVAQVEALTKTLHDLAAAVAGDEGAREAIADALCSVASLAREVADVY